ncbi:MAG TPA: sugar ABC transporter ATP-binding protein, partial [Polyangia bacterium]
RAVEELTVAEQQLVQIAAAVGSGARVIIFDEPTSSLSQQEADHLYGLLGRLRDSGVTCVYVSHRMPEIFRLCDTITVLRDGHHVATQPTKSLDEAALVEMMIGRRLDQYLPKLTTRAPGDVVLRANGLSSSGKFRDVTFEVRAGEIVGLAGLVGAGRSEVAKAIFGLDDDVTGRIEIAGLALGAGSPAAAMRAGIGLVPEDRKRQGFIPGMTGFENLALPLLPSLARWGWLPAGAERAVATDAFKQLNMPAPNLAAPTVGLSGGNQQKIVFAKWLAARCRLLILDEPTRGVDVGAKAEIHALIRDLAESGTAVLLISSELPELIALSGRMLVLREGRLVGELPRGSDQGSLMRLMAGVDGARTDAVVSAP